MGEGQGEPTESQQPPMAGEKKTTGGAAEKGSSPRTQSFGMASIEAAKRALDPMKDKHPLGEDSFFGMRRKPSRPQEHVDRPDPEP